MKFHILIAVVFACALSGAEAFAACGKSLEQYCSDRWRAPSACKDGGAQIKIEVSDIDGISDGCRDVAEVRNSFKFKAAIEFSENARCFDDFILPESGKVCKSELPELITRKCCEN
jgi:hypothetical protein